MIQYTMNEYFNVLYSTAQDLVRYGGARGVNSTGLWCTSFFTQSQGLRLKTWNVGLMKSRIKGVWVSCGARRCGAQVRGVCISDHS